MERLPPHGGSRGSSSEAITLVYLPATSAAPPQPASEPSCRFGHERGSDTIKAQIMSHPRYPALLRAFIDCQKVGAPPEDVGRLSALARELEPCPDGRREQPSDPELDQFMEAYCDVLVKYREELTRPIQEADEFFRSVEAQLHSFGLDNEKCEGGGGGSSDEEEEAEMEFFPEVVVSGGTTEDTELKSQLLNKYSGYLSSLWKELSKKKKKGKLPRDARQKLLHWWHLHYRWPYPSEKEKAALAESTGLDAKQINNWFINQRKRHWKPTPGVDRLHPAAGAASTSSSAALCMGGQYCFLGESTYPRGP